MALTVADERFKLNPTGPAIGIDLGTTNSRVGYFINNNVEIITTASGKKTMPSYVFYNGKEECMVGEPAVAQWNVCPNRVAYDSKRMIGLNYDDNVVNRNKSFWTFTVTKSDNNRPIYDIDKNHQVLPEEVSSEILKELFKMAQDKIGTEKIKSAVITVPDHFLVGQKEATLYAAKLAGIENVKLITEPTAAALAYGFDHKRFGEYNLFVFDLGGGTCDVSIVKVEKGELKVIGHAGDTQLGGRDYDNHLIQYFDQKHKDLRLYESMDEFTAKRKMRLREACEDLKIALSYPGKVAETINLDDVAPGLPDEDLTYKQFKEIVANLTRRCRKLCFDALEEIELKADDIDEVLLVGGSSKMRVIKDMLKEVFPTKELSEAINPDEVLAYGATLRAAQLLDPEKSKDFGIVDSLANGIGVALPENRYHFLIKRNTPIPTRFGPVTYSTIYNNQTVMNFYIYQGERISADKNHFIMDVKLEGLPKKRAEEVKATLEIELDANGFLTAVVRGWGKEVTKQVNFNEKKTTGKMIEDMYAYMEINYDRNSENDRIIAARMEIIKNINFLKWDCEEWKRKKPREILHFDGLLKECKEVEKWLCNPSSNNSNIKLCASVDEKNVNLEKFVNRHYGHGISVFQQTMNNIVLVNLNCWSIPFLVNAFQTYYTFIYDNVNNRMPALFANKSSLEPDKFLTSKDMAKSFDTSKIPDIKDLKVPKDLTIYELKHEDKSLAISVIDLFEFSIKPKSIPAIIKWIRKIKQVDAICLVISINNLSNFEDEITDSLSGISTIDLGKTVIFIIHKTYDLTYITTVTLRIHDVVAEYYKKRNAVFKKGYDNIFVFNTDAYEHLLKEQFEEIAKVLQESWYHCVNEFQRFLNMPVFKQKKFIIVEE